MTQRIARRAVGLTGLELSELGFGAAPVGNLFRRVTDAEAGSAITTALDAGLSYIDTAPYYGFGLSERRVGDAVRDRPEAIVSTKVGRLLRPLNGVTSDAERDGFHSRMPFEPVYDYTYSGVMRSWEASLHRLGLNRIDILYVHDIGAATHGEQNAGRFMQLVRGGFRALEELRDCGAISAFGLGVNECEVCLQAFKHTDLDMVLLAGRYTLLEQGPLDTFLPTCLKSRVAVVAGGVYNSGILASGTRGKDIAYYNYAPAPPDIIDKVAKIEAVCDAHGVSLRAAALQFSLGHPAVTSTVLGLGNVQQVTAALQSYEAIIPADFWQELKKQGLLREEAPLPAVR